MGYPDEGSLYTPPEEDWHEPITMKSEQIYISDD